MDLSTKYKIAAYLVVLPSFVMASESRISELEGNTEKAFQEVLTSVESGMDNGEIRELVLRGLDSLIARGVAELEAEGHKSEAQFWADSWEGQIFSFDLGDHEPLVQWLSDYYLVLESKLGEKIMRLAGLEDIKIFNHGIPVTFHPNGWRGDDWDIEEYRLHFVPVAAAVTYWMAYSACSVTAPPLVGHACGLMSRAPRWGMKKFIAPKLSDRVYRKFRKS